MWLGRVLSIAVKNCPLRWPMNEGEKDGLSLLLWMKIKYEYEAKIYPLKKFYSYKLRSLKLRVNGNLHDYIEIPDIP